MTPAEVAAKLRQFNEWRRGDYGPSEQPEPPNPYEVGLAIDAAVEMIDRLEAAESARRDDYQNWMTALDRNAELLAKLEAAEKERDALRADKATLQQMTYSLKDRLEVAEKERDVLRAKNDRMDGAMESLLIRCDDSDSVMYGTLSTSFVRDTVRIAREALGGSK